MNRNIINCLLLITFMVFTGVVRGQSASCSDYINAFPWTYGFEDATSGSQSTPNASFGATCWTHHNDASAPDAVGYPYIIAYTPHSGSKALYWYRSNAESYGTYHIVVLPGVDPAAASVNTLELSFWVKPSNASYQVTFVVGVMTDPTDVSTFVAVGDPIQVTGSDWSEVGMSLSSYSGTGQYVAIRANSAPSLYWSASVDDFTLSQIESCPAVKNLRMTACGTDEITVAWTPKGTASSWKVSIDGVVSGIATSPTYTFSNLTANTTHTVSVVSQCGGEESAAATLQVSTIAEPITTLPYSCDFEGAAAIVMVNGDQPNQWMTGSGPNTTTGGENSLFIHSTDATNTYDVNSSSTVFAYIPFELPAGSYIIEYDWRSYGDYRDFMRVAMVPATTLLEAGNATGWSQTSIPGIAVDGGSGLCYQQDWQHITKSFNIPTDGIYKLVFFWTNNDASGYPPPAAIDNISLRVCTCPFDASVYTLNVEQTSVSLGWSGYDADYRLEYGPSGFQRGTGTVMNVTGTTATMGGLTATTEYDVYISLVCTENDVSLPIRHTFATLTGPVSSFPWQCNFEGYSTEGWGMEDDGGSNHWTTGYTVYNSPDHGLFVSNDSYSGWDYDNSSASSVYAWRELQLEAASYQIGFQWQAIGEGDGGSAPDDYLTVRLVPEAEWGTSGGMVIFGPADNMSYWDNASIPVTITNAGNYRLVFEWHNDDDGTGYGSAAIDDIEIVKVGSTSPTDPGTAFPWTCDFEGASDSEGWTIASNGDNAWYIGTAVNNGGSNALYVSNDGGVNNAYATNTASVSYAYRVFDFAAAEYQLSFDWLCDGESTYDFLRVALAPEGTSLPDDPNQWPSSGDLSGFTFIDGGACLSQGPSWATQTTTFTVPTAGRYWVIFVWRNDDSYGTQPPAAVDNIEISSRTCSVPTSLTVNDLSSTLGSLQWTGTAPSYVVKYGPVTSYDYWHSDYDAYTAYTVDGTALDLTGLVSGTEYIVGIRSICAVGDTSDFATFTFTTPTAITPMPVPYSCDFESGNSEWLLDNGSYTNQWHIGTAANNTVSGNNALYVSDDAGLTNHYSDNSAQLYAVTALAFEAGTYTIDYDWRCYAGSDDDFIVRLVSTTYDYTYNFSYIHLDDGNLRYSSDWMHAHNMFTITDAGTYYLVIYWSNSTSIGSQPPAAIDNIYVAPVASHIPPYTCSFETSNEESDWYITNDYPNSANRWSFGTAAGSVGSGTQAIYISNDGGTSYAATSNYRDNMYAVTLLSLQAGEYNLSFDWKGVGHENSEFLKVVLTPTANGWNSSQGIATDALFGATDWQTYSQVVTITQPGDYFLALSWKHTSTDYGAPAAIDNISFVPNTCPAPTNLAATYSDGTLQLTWTPGGTESSWRVGDGSADHDVTTPTFSIPNALPAHSYHFTVQALCGTAEVGTPATLDYRTNYYCADMNVFYASDQALSTAANATMPVSNTSNYSLTQTIFEASELPDPNYIHAIAFYYEPTLENNMMTTKNDVDIYFMPTDKTAFSSTTDYVNLSADAVLVYSGPLNCTPGWNYFEFTTPYLYVGGNLMMIVDDNSGARDSDIGGYNYTFRVRDCDGNKTLVNTSTSSYNRNIDPHNITGAGGLSIYSYRPEMRLISCGNVNTALYHITLQQEGSGSISVTGSDIVPADYVFAGTELTITATPAQDYLTASFNVNGVSVSSPYTFTVSSDLDIQAVFLPAAPDLHVTSLTYTPLVNGQEATITWTVRNDGTVPTPAGVSWNDYLYINRDNEAEIIAGNSKVITLGQFPNLRELGVGESYTQQATITLPSDLASSCYLVVVTNERDARDIQCPEGASPAENSSAPFCTAYSQYSPSFTEVTHILNPNRHDNFLAKSVTIEDIPRPDLHVVGLSYPAELTTYTSVNISWTVRNDGTAATPTWWTDHLYLSSEPYIDNTNASSVVTLWSGSNLNALGVGESYMRTVSVTLPGNLATGDYYIIATADAARVANVTCLDGTDVTTQSGVAPYCTALTRNKQFVEPNSATPVEGYVQHDNFIIRAVHVNQQLPDLHVTDLTIPTELTTYTPVNVSWTVRNDGTAATPTLWTDRIYLSSEPYIDNTNASNVVTLWSGDNLNALGVGEIYTRTVSVTLPGITTGDYYIIATADAARVANVTCPDGTDVTTQSGVAPYCTALTTDKNFIEPNSTSSVEGYVQHDNFIIRAVHVDQQLPDLHVANLTIPTELTTYTSVNISWTERNDGTAATPTSWTDRLYLSSEPYIDNTNASSVVTLWSGDNLNALGVGESYTRTVSVTLPGNLATGDYYIIATADAALVANVSCPDGTNVTTQSGVAPYCTALTPNKQLVEPNRASPVVGFVQHDNFIIRAVHVDQQLPDLHVANLSIPTEITSYTSFLVRWTVHNDGTAATPTSWADCIFLSSEPYIDNTNASSVVTLWSGYNLNVLGVGESYMRTVSVTLPGNLATGDYYIIATADATQVANVSCPDGTNVTTQSGVAPYCTALTRNKQFVEPNSATPVEGYVQHDNFIIRTVHVDQQLPDLHVADLIIPTELTTYMPVNISWTVRNDGTAATLSSWTDRLYLSSDPYIDNSNASSVVNLWSGDNLNALGVSESYTRTVSVTLPGNLATGDYYIIATADATQVANVSCPDGTNATTLTGVAPYCTALTYTKNLVEPNRTSSVEGYVQHDNFIIRTVHVDQQLPDLHVANLTIPTELTTYTSVNVSWTVRNDGTIATPTSWTDRLYLSSEPYINNSNASSVVTLWSGSNLNALGVGENYTRTVSVTPPGNLATGDYYIIATADAAQVANVSCPEGTNVTTQLGVAPYCTARTPNKQLVEPNSTSSVEGFVQHDNFIIRGVHVDQQLPDLHVADLIIPTELTTYMPVNISWTVRNDGTAATPTSWTDHLYLSSDPYIDNSNASSIVTLWSGNRLNDLGAGESYTRTVSVTLPGNLATGDYYIIATADAALVANVSCPDGTNVTTQSGVAPYCIARTPEKQFVEPNSTSSVEGFVQHDNFIIRTVHVLQQLPDLSVSAVSHSDLCVGYNIGISFVVTNSGAAATPQNISWTDKIFLSTTPELTNSSTLLGSYTNLRPLTAGDSYTRNVYVTISQPGDYYLIVSTDHDNDVWEPDEVGSDNRYNHYVEAVNVSTTPLAQLHAVDVNCGDIYTGQLTNASFTVRNEGLVATPNGVTWTDYLYLSYTPDGRDKLLGSWESVSTLDAGGEYTRDVSFTLPLTYSTGEYYLVLVTNPNADPLLFGDHYDNTISIPVNVVLPPIADLQVTNIHDYPVSVYSGRPLTVRYTISNIGAGPTSSSGWRDLLFISTNPDITDLATLANEAIFLAENRVTRENPLISGSSVDKRFSVQTTQPELYGTYYLYVATNVDEDEYEFTNYGNNITRSTEPMEIMLGFISDLSVYQLEADEEATHDGYLKFKYYVRNSEEKHAWPCWVAEYQIESAIKRSEFYMPRWTDKVFLSSTPDLMGVQINSAGQQVAAGHNQVDIANDEWYYLLNSTPDNYPGIGYAKVHVSSVPCEEPIYPWAGYNEGDVGKYVYCRMDSNRYVDGGWPNDYLLGQMPSHLGYSLHHPDAPSSGYLDENLRNGDHYQKKYKSTYPDFLPESGTYYIVVYTDSEHEVMEYEAEGNNKASTPITLNRYYHNFTLSDLSIDRTSLVPGYSVNADLTLHNAGGLNFNDSLDIHVYCSNSFAQDADGYVRTTDPATETPGGRVTRLCYTLKDKYLLKHNTSQDLSLRVPMPDDLPDGTYTLYFVVNPTIHTQGVTRRHESQYGDNVIGSEQIDICRSCPMPDLMADNLEIPQSITAGDDITIEFDVHNNGTQSLNGNAVYTAFHVRLAGSDQWTWCPVKQQSEPTPVSHPTTPGGGSEHYVQTVSIPPMLGEGDYICRLTVDANDNVMEAVESDNELVYGQMIHIAAHPLFLAIRVNDVTPGVPSTVHPGEPSTMRAGDPYRIAWIVELDHNRPAFHRIESYEKIDSVGYSETIDWEEVPENQNAWVERVYFSTDDDLSDDDIVLKTVGVSYSKATTVFHNPRFYLSGAENVRIPRDIVGEGYIIIEIDADHQTPDTNRANNFYVKPVTVTEAAPEEEQDEQDDSDDPYDPFNPYSPTNPVNPVNPPTPTEPDLPSDLVITAFNVPASVHQRDVVDIEYTITNIGDHPAKGTWTDKVYDGAQESLADSWLASYLYLAKNSHTFTLAPGASKTMTVQVVFPDSEPGHYPITLWADAGDKVNETDKTNNYMTVYYDLLYAAPCDLTVTDIQNTTDVTIGADLHVEWTLKNVGYNSLTGIVHDGVYLSADQTIDNSDYLIGEIGGDLTLDGEATRVREGDFSLQGVPSGSYYLIVRTNMPNAFMESDYDNNRLVSTSRVTVSLPTLVIGQEETFTLASNHTTAYRLEVGPNEAGKTLALSMVTDAPTRSNDGLYLSHEEMPTTGHYDFGSNTPYVERQQVIVPVAEAGTYYILVSGATIKNIEQEITLLATILEFGIISVDANTGGNAGSFTTVVTGASFDSVMDFRLVREGNYYPAQRVKFKDACTNYVTFNLTDMPVGSYDMEAELPGGIVARKANAFEVTEGLPEDLRCKIHAPDAVRTDQNVEINFVYYNAGTNDVEIAGFMIVSGNNHPLRETPFTIPEIIAMNKARYWPDTLIFYIAEQGMELGVIRPGQGGSKRFFTFTNKLYYGDELDIKVYAIGTRKE